MNRHVRRALAATTATALGLGAAVAVAAPASADDWDIATPTIEWLYVADDALYIDEAQASYPDLFGSGVDVEGWTSDAFDGFLNEFSLSHDEETIEPVLVPVSASIDGNGVSRIVSSGSATFADETTVEFLLTLEIQGNYARWTFAFTGDTAVGVDVAGEVGSDSSTVYVPVGDDALVSHDLDGWDPIVGYQVEGSNAAFYTGAPGSTAFSASTAAPLSIVLALQDYDPCSRDAAIAEMTARAASLASTFGQLIFPPSSSCASLATPAGFVSGATTNQTLAVTVADGEIGDEIRAYLAAEDVQFALAGLPEGLTATFDRATLTFTLSGTAAAGAYDFRVAFFAADEDGGFSPFFLGPQSFTVAPAAVPQLADSGLSDVSPVLVVVAILLILAGAGALVVRRVRTSR